MATLAHYINRDGKIDLSISKSITLLPFLMKVTESTPLFCRFWNQEEQYAKDMDDAIQLGKVAANSVGMNDKAEWILEYCDHHEVPELFHEGGHAYAFRPGQVVNYKGCFHRINRIMAIPSLFHQSLYAGIMSAVVEIECWDGKKFVGVDQIKRVRGRKKVSDLIDPVNPDFLTAGQECEVGDFI